MSLNFLHIKPILEDLDRNSFINQYDVLKYEHTALKFQLRLRIEFANQSVLFTNEYIAATVRKYAFHWQQLDDINLVRWDNAPHFPKLLSFPHHKHDYRQNTEVVTESFDISLTDVLTYIHSQLTN